MTAKEFIKSMEGKPNSKNWEFMLQAYAKHLEAAQWVTDGSLPPPEPDSKRFSVDVLSENGTKCYTALQSGKWYSTNGDLLEAPKAWRFPPKIIHQCLSNHQHLSALLADSPKICLHCGDGAKEVGSELPF